MDERTDSMKDLMKQVNSALELRYAQKSGIKKMGKNIVVPNHLSYRETADMLIQWEDDMEEWAGKEIKITGHPSDMLVATDRAVSKLFGEMIGQTTFSFFGRTPGQTRTVEIAYGEHVTVPYGKVKIPHLKDITMNVNVREKTPRFASLMRITFEYLRKYEPFIEEIEAEIHNQLRNHSIFLQQAINSRFEFVDLNGFDIAKLVYSEQEKKDLEAHIFKPILRTRELESKGIDIARTVLLFGPFGTGKSLTALVAANKCVENGWTFMNVTPGDSIVEALEFARNYEPCLVFFEDIDQVSNENGARDERLNEILNTMDGVLSKGSRVMTILTTNNIEGIQQAMTRPGRIDGFIEMGRLDEGSLEGLVRVYLGDALVEEPDISMLMPAAEEYTPCFVTEACKRSMLYSKDEGGITNEVLRDSLLGIRQQFDLTMKDRGLMDMTIDTRLRSMMKEVVQDGGQMRSTSEVDHCPECGECLHD
jgi:transitional endoplasmic reticulum ATPase